MDVLSEVLKAVKLDGAMFYNAEFSAPWCFRSPASHTWRRIFRRLQTRDHLSSADRGPRLRTRRGRRPADSSQSPGTSSSFRTAIRTSWETVRPSRRWTARKSCNEFCSRPQGLPNGRRGEITKFICGYMACEPQLSRIFLGGLPPILKVSIRDDASGQWLENSIRYSVGNADASRPGGEAVLAKLSEVLFVETLRRYIALLPQEQTGWLAGVRDPEVGKALALLHRKPAHPWTIAALANEVGISRSVLAERFRRYLSETPIAYLTRWRLQLGAQMLKSTSSSVAQIAAEVGYESEPSFNRAFKREFGLPPARFRSQSKSARSRADA